MSPASRRDALKIILTALSETTIVFASGCVSSGKAELKFQSSSAGAPFGAFVTAGCWGPAKSNIEPEGVGADACDLPGFAKILNGSACGGFGACAAEGTGVADLEDDPALEKAPKAS